jgi:type IV secretory pathway VirB2 component (pilin)
MESWLQFFVVVAALALVLQAVILATLYFQFRRQSQRIEKIVQELHGQVTPILARIQVLVEDAQPHISSILSDAAEITHVARTQVQRVDRVLAEAVERLRLQLVHADQILTGVLETIEDTGPRLRRTLSGPVQSVTALVRGIQVGIEFFRGNRRPADSPGEQPDESLFI